MKVLVSTSVSLPKDMIRKLDQIRDPKEMSRSGLIRLVMNKYLESEKERKNEMGENRRA